MTVTQFGVEVRRYAACAASDSSFSLISCSNLQHFSHRATLRYHRFALSCLLHTLRQLWVDAGTTESSVTRAVLPQCVSWPSTGALLSQDELFCFADGAFSAGMNVAPQLPGFTITSRAMSQEERVKVKRDILAYLRNHPEAQDTAEGIAQWWLLEQRLTAGVSLVKQVLDELRQQGFVIRRIGGDAREHYSFNRDWFAQVQKTLDNSK